MPNGDLHGLVYIIGKSKFVRVRPVLWIFVKKSKMVQVTEHIYILTSDLLGVSHHCLGVRLKEQRVQQE